MIPSKSNQRRQPRFNREAYRQRNRIERLTDHLKQFRRSATCYEKRGVNHLAMVMLGVILLWLQPPLADTPYSIRFIPLLGRPTVDVTTAESYRILLQKTKRQAHQ